MRRRFWTELRQPSSAGILRKMEGNRGVASGSTQPGPRSAFSRRGFLQALGVGGAALVMRDFLPSFSMARAADSTPLYFICCTFEGGWDQLLALDPRDNTVYNEPTGTIYTAYDLLADSDTELAAVLSGNPSGVVRPNGSNLSFGPAVGRLAEGDLWQHLCLVRGVNMGTLTHEVGRRYFLTGKFPRGLAANGSALATVLVDQRGDLSTIPNLVMGTETYNEGLENFASGLVVQDADDLQLVLTPIGETLDEETRARIDAYLQTPRCSHDRLNGNQQITQYLASRQKAVTMVEDNLGSLFDFPATPDTPELEALYAAFHISTTSTNQANRDLAGVAGDAMIAAQAITHDVSQAVSIRLANGIDTHDDSYLTDHSPALRTGFNALADLITYLKSVSHPTTGKAFWDHCVLLVTSDFARTPALNNRDGRDHHLSSSCLVAGPGIQGNRVIGGTDEWMAGEGVDLSTGAVVGSNGTVLRPPDIHATLLASMGLDYSHLSNQSPVLVQAMLKS